MSSSTSGSSGVPADITRASGAWLELWLPCVVFAHVFAATWLLLALVKMKPQYGAALRRVAAATRAWVWARARKRAGGGGGAAAADPPGPIDESPVQQHLPSRMAQDPAAAAATAASGLPDQAAARLAPAAPYEASAAAAAELQPQPQPPRPGARAEALLSDSAGDVPLGSGRRPWIPPLPSLPPSEPGSAMAHETAADSAGGFAPDVGASAPPLAAAHPGVVPRRWTAIGVPKADKTDGTALHGGGGGAAAATATAAVNGGGVETGGGAGGGGAGGGAAAAAGAAGGVRRRTVTMHHAVTDADLVRSGKTVRLAELAEGWAPPPRPVSRQAREIMSALAAAGAAPDMRVLRRVSSNVRRICIEWQDLGCVYDTSSGPKTVLQGVYGRAVPGDLLGLLGPSGAGKSTLLDVLAARKRVGQLSGKVLVDGRPRDDDAFVRRSAYVPQDDHFIPTLSTWEVITFVASLVLPAATSPAGRRKRCAEVLAAMGLSRQGATLVGGTLPGGLSLRGLSGGERKRLAIATGIVAAPSALLLDEPTSGLDAAAALGVMQYMHALAQAGHVVLASVHQPRAAIWSMFTQVVVLSRGRLMYSGDRAGALPWFTSGLGYCYDPQRHGVVSDWIMDLVNTTFKKPRRIYGRMMTTAADVDTAADAFLRRYKEVRQQHELQAEQDELDEHRSRRYSSAPEDSAAPDRRLVPAGSASGDALPMYDSLDRARTSAAAASGVMDTAAAATASQPPLGMHLSPSMLAHRGSTEAPSGGGGGGGGGGSVSGTAGSPAVLPESPRSNSMFHSSVGGGGAPFGSFGRGPSGRSTAGASAAVAGSMGSFGRGASARSGRTDPEAAGGGGGGGGPGNPFSEPGNAALVDTRSSHTSTTPPRRGILRTASSARRSPDAAAPSGLPAQYGGGDAAGAAGLAAAAARALDKAAAWSSSPEGRRQERRQERRLEALQQQPGWLRQVRVLTWRELMSMTRNPADVAGRMLIFCWIAVVVGIIFYSVGNYFEAIRSRLDVMFIETCVLLLLPYVYMSLYTADKQYYTADLSAKLYSPSAYYVAKVLAVLPFGVLCMLVFSFTIYGMSGLRRSGAALAEHGVLACLAYLCASQVLYAAAVATPNQDTAFMVAIAWTAVNILMSNYLLRYDDMTMGWLTKILRWFSVMMWCFQGMASAEYRNQFYSCSSGFGTNVLSSLPAYLPGNANLRYTAGALGDPGSNCAIDTNNILDYFGMDQPFWRLAVILLGYLAVLHVITYAALRLTAGRERR